MLRERTIKGMEIGLEEQEVERSLRTWARVKDKVKRGQNKNEVANKRQGEGKRRCAVGKKV